MRGSLPVYAERDAQITELYRAGATSRQIAEKLQLTPSTVAGVIYRSVPESHKPAIKYRPYSPYESPAGMDTEPYADGRPYRNLHIRIDALHRKLDAVLRGEYEPITVKPDPPLVRTKWFWHQQSPKPVPLP